MLSTDISSWMLKRHLKQDISQTELLSTPHQTPYCYVLISINDHSVFSVGQAKNLGNHCLCLFLTVFNPPANPIGSVFKIHKHHLASYLSFHSSFPSCPSFPFLSHPFQHGDVSFQGSSSEGDASFTHSHLQ